jgi:hypothetical protein
MRVGLGCFGMRIGEPLDSNDRQDNDRRGIIRAVATAKAHNAPLFREFDNVAHQPLSSAAGSGASCPDVRKSASLRLSGMQG